MWFLPSAIMSRLSDLIVGVWAVGTSLSESTSIQKVKRDKGLALAHNSAQGSQFHTRQDKM